MALAQRELGKSGIKVSAIGLGCMSFSGVYGPADDAASIELIHDALDRGITFLDSSDAYGKGHNETLLGKALAQTDPDRARTHLQKFLKLAPNDPDAKQARELLSYL